MVFLQNSQQDGWQGDLPYPELREKLLNIRVRYENLLCQQVQWLQVVARVHRY